MTLSEGTPSVLLLTENGDSGGIGRYCLDLAEILGPSAALVCLCPRPTAGCPYCWLRSHCESRGLRLVTIPMEARQWEPAFRDLRMLWDSAGRPIVHTNGRRGNFVAQALAMVEREFFFVTTVHGVLGMHDRRNMAYRLVDLAACRSAAAAIAVSAETRRRLVGMGSPPSRTLCIPNGLRAEDMALLCEMEARRPAERKAGTSIRVGYLGRLSREKGVEDFAEMGRRLLSLEGNVELVVAGDGPLREHLLEETKELSDPAAFNYLGEMQSVHEVLGAMDVLVMPSHNEGLPYVLLEAMASGCAVVAYGVGGILEVITDRSLGVIVRPGDSRGLLDAVLGLVRRPQLSRALGSRASEYVRERYRLGRWLPMLQATYEMTGSRRRGPIEIAHREGRLRQCV